jgi:serine/threonine protein kinase/Flp pilus assembly protein TadD
VLGDYELVGELGRGGMGVVYLARQRSLGRLVALKLLPAALAGDAAALARFRREVRALARVDHPNVVKVLASGTLPDGQPYYAMEYVAGCDLEQLWQELSGGAAAAETAKLGTSTWASAVRSASRKKRAQAAKQSGDGAGAPPGLPPLPPDPPELPEEPGGYVRRVAEVGRDAAKAVQAAHDAGLVHRDVKPANLMLTADGGRVVLMDFGLAKAAGMTLSASRQGGLLGTLRYAAPEQLAAATLGVGPAADVRGLGVTLWELLTRRRLFADAQDERQLAALVHDADVPPLRSVDRSFDRDLEAIVARATERRASERVPSAGRLAEYLQLYLDGRPLPIRPPGVRELAWRWLRSHRGPVAAAAAGLAALLLGVTLVVVVVAQMQGADSVVAAPVDESRKLLQGTREVTSVGELVARCAEARAAANRAVQLAQGRFVSEGMRREAAEALADAEEALDASRRDEELLNRLLDVTTPRETHNYARDDSGHMLPLAEPTEEEQYQIAFRAWGLDVDATPAGQAAGKLAERPDVVRTAVAAGLDGWAALRRRTGQGDWRRLGDLAARTDPDTSPGRAELRTLLGGDALRSEAVAAAARAIGPGFGPLGALATLAPGPGLARLREQVRRRESTPSPAVLLLARALQEAGDGPGAERLLRAAARVHPREAALWGALGRLLEGGAAPDWAGAVECYQAARVANPALGVKLAEALANAGRAGEGVALLQDLVRERPGVPDLRCYLGNALKEQGRVKEAEAEYRAALRLKPDLPEARNNLGVALSDQGRVKEAEAELRAALRLRPDLPEAHNGLGNALKDQGRVKEAEAEYREALRLRPDYPEARNNLGFLLRAQGRFAESLAEFRRGHELGSRQPGWSYPSAEWVREAERLVTVDAALTAALRAGSAPADARQAAEFAQMCLEYRNRTAAAARFFAEAFADAKVAADLRAQRRYNAARAAALAAAGKGLDATRLPAKARTTLRRQALAWLRADLTVWEQFAGNPQARATIQQTLRHWQEDTDLAALRDPGALVALPADEREAWQALWADVDRLLTAAGGR